MRVVKTWVNSWATSDRFHEAVHLPCLFGYEAAKDKTSHYVMCPILCHLLTQFRSGVPDCPLKRIGLVDPTRQSLLTLACAFAGYHATRRANIISCAQTLDNSQRHAAHRTFADAFWVEAMDNGLQCRHFKPSFDFSMAACWPSHGQD